MVVQPASCRQNRPAFPVLRRSDKDRLQPASAGDLRRPGDPVRGACAVRLDAEPFACNVEAAVSLSLIANELIAASFSHIIESDSADATLISVVFRVHRQTNVIERVISLTRDYHASWSVADLIHPSDIVDVLAEQIGAELTLTLDAGPMVRLAVPTSRFAT